MSLVLALLLVQALFSQGTGTVAGFVLDGQTGRPISGAAVEVNGNRTQTMVTD